MDSNAQSLSSGYSLGDPKISSVLDRLHRRARGDYVRFPRLGASEVMDRVLGRKPTVAERGARMKEIFVCISRDQGRFAYLVARSIEAKRIVEFGTSFGVSTIYFAAAVKDNGGGIVIGSEIEEAKAARANVHLKEAGLDEYVDIRIGDAEQTLTDCGGMVDLVLMDGWKDLYLPLIKILTPQIRPGAVVLADNIHTFKKTLAPYVTYMENPANGFSSVTLPISDGMQYSVRLPA